ncbi:MAG: glycosyltransferase family 39 protein [Chloroflexia bacterium]|nr:glycosyltransferase family 39 protein [Chloroflexia bacterium]
MTRREWRELGLILLLALALRLTLLWLLQREQLVSDEPEFMGAAYWLAHGRGFSFYQQWPWLRPPLYLLWLAPFMRLFGPTLAPIRLAQVVLSLTVPALTYLLSRLNFGHKVARLAGLITALWSPLAVLPHLVLAENLFLPLLLGAFSSLVRFQQEPRPRWLLLGGGLLGLATLAKGLTLAFLPLAALWVLWQGLSGEKALRWRWSALWQAALLTGAVLATILPWSAYNVLRYRQPILVDTTGGYNFWLGTQGGQFEHLQQVHQDLLAIPDPAGRQAYAYRQGLAAIAEDPGGYLSSRLGELGQLLRVNYSADERLLDGFVLGQVPIPHLLAVFLLEDLAYMLLVPLALLALFNRRGEAGRGLVLSWLLYNLGTALVFFAINRFRLPLLPLLAIYAAVTIAREPWGQGQPRVPRLMASSLACIAFWVVVLPSVLGPYPAAASATWLGIRGRTVAKHLERAEAAITAGDLAEAQEALHRALSHRPDGVQPLPTARVVQAMWRRAQGDDMGALDLLEDLDWYQALLLRGDILREWGHLDQAQSLFAAREVDTHNPTQWAWEHLQPPALSEIDLGGDLDLGLVDGFYLGESDGEQSYRWSSAEARLRFPGAGTGQPQTLRLSLHGWRPAGEAPAQLSLWMDGQKIGRLTVPAAWEQHSLPLPAVPPGQDVVLNLQCNAFMAGPRDLLETASLRFLGLMISKASLE